MYLRYRDKTSVLTRSILINLRGFLPEEQSLGFSHDLVIHLVIHAPVCEDLICFLPSLTVNYCTA